MDARARFDVTAPVSGTEPERLDDGVALCLSGGGYRAMLFHAGALWRLNELGYLPRLERVSSVSGGSITAGLLGLRWSALTFGPGGVAANFEAEIVAPLRVLGARTVDVPSVLRGILTPGKTVADFVARAYRALFADATLAQLPDRPRFVINATNLQTGALWRFSKPYMADYTIGVIPSPTVELAKAVAASSAFPPVLSPVTLGFDERAFATDGRGVNFAPPFTGEAVLSDGGVYDNLGLETAWKRYRTILVSDGGGKMAAEAKIGWDWGRQGLRVNSVIDNQVRSLRKRQTITAFERGDRDGAYWGIRSHTADYGPPAGSLACPPEETAVLAATRTRLKALDDRLQERLINWGYAICDVAMRRWVAPDAAPASGFPYPGAALG